MAEIYISLFGGLLHDSNAIELIRKSEVISGIEVYSLTEHFALIKNTGLKCAAHDPQVDDMNNLGNSEWLSLFSSDKGKQVIELIKNTDSPVVAFHCGFSAQKIYKMRAYPDAAVASTISKNRQILLSTIAKNIIGIERLLNQEENNSLHKHILLEPMDFSRKKPVNWHIQSEEVKAHKLEIKRGFEKYGINAALQWVTDISFFDDLFRDFSKQGKHSIGFLFDISHVFIAADAKIHSKMYSGTIEDYFDELIEIVKYKVYQIHVNVPEGNPEDGYTDAHLPFKEGDALSDRILKLTRKVINCSPNLKIITLEIRGSQNMIPFEFARLMIQQVSILKSKN